MVITSDLCESMGLNSSQAMLKKKPSWIAGNISEFDQPLLIGLTKLLKPKKVVEIGVASGWSGCLFIEALSQNGLPAQYVGIDLSSKYYLDSSRDTGSAILEMFPDASIGYELLLGSHAIDNLKEIGDEIDLAFIDGDHRHPWAILDFLSLLPNLSPKSYVLIHDLNLSTYPRHEQTNRGPKYLFECWPFDKIHSSQNLPMIGAVKMPELIDSQFLTLILNTTCTPWETNVDQAILNKISASIGLHYGEIWGEKFNDAFHKMNVGAYNNHADNIEKDFIEQLIQVVSRNPYSSSHLAMLECATLVYPDSGRLYHHLSVLKYRNNDVEKAIKFSLKAVKFSKTNAHFISFLGELYCATNELAEAERCLVSAIELQEDVAIFHYRLAHLYEKSGQLKDAIFSARRACELLPNNSHFEKYFNHLSSSL